MGTLMHRGPELAADRHRDRDDPEGWVHLTDRSKEMIKVNGFQVAPPEVEAVPHGHPAVRGVDDERAGEVPVALGER